MTKSNASLKVVATLEDELTELFDERARVAGRLRSIDGLISMTGRALATERGVAFIRFETLQREFGRDG